MILNFVFFFSHSSEKLEVFLNLESLWGICLNNDLFNDFNCLFVFSVKGDFAVLLKAGMTVKQAVLYNALSAMLAYLGMATGIFIGHYAENVSMWIFALTAGLFMYVALVDMVSF